MKDIRLWQLLAERPTPDGERAAAIEANSLTVELKSLLAELSQLGPRSRMPFLGRLKLLATADDERLRELQVQIFSGASGWTAWQYMLHFTQDKSLAVQRAAVIAILESAKLNPWLLNHLVFHPDLEIRRMTVQNFVDANGPIPAILLHLLADENCESQISAAITSQGLVDQAPPQLVVALQQNRLLSDDMTRSLIATMPQHRLLECVSFLPRFSSDECATILAFEQPIPPQWLRPAGGDYDGLQWMLELFWNVDSPSASSPKTFDQVDGAESVQHQRFFEMLFEIMSLHAKLEFPRRVTAAAMVTAAKLGKWNIRVAGLCATMDPTFLLRSHIPRHIRRQAAESLYIYRDRVPEATNTEVEAILRSPLCRRENGHLDLWLIGAVLHYIPKAGLGLLMIQFKTSQIVSAFLADPTDSLPFFSYNGSIEKRLELIDAIRAQRGPMASLLDAMLLQIVAADGLQFLDRLDGKQVLGMLVELMKLLEKSANRLSARKIVVAGSILNSKLTANQASSFLKSWLKQSAPTSFGLGLELLAQFVRFKFSADEFVAFAKTLDVDQLKNLLDCIAHSSGFPYGTEILLASTLIGHTDETILAWAEVRAPRVTSPKNIETTAKSVMPTHRKTSLEPVHTVAGERAKPAMLEPPLAAAIQTCPEADLSSVIKDCLKVPRAGLCEVLAKRADPLKPNLNVAAAILGCADSPLEIDRQFVRFGIEEKAFLESLDELMVKFWAKSSQLAVTANAWLWRWEAQAFEFADQTMRNSQQLQDMLSVVALMRSSVLANEYWSAVNRVLSVWRYREPKKFALFFDVELLELVAAELTERNAESAAEILVSAFNSQLVITHLAGIKTKVVERLPDFSQAIRLILQPWIDSRGVPTGSVAQRSQATRLDAEFSNQINVSTDLGQLKEWCLHHDSSVVTNAALRCVMLGGQWLTAMIGLFENDPCPIHSSLLAETVSLWPKEFFGEAERLGSSDKIEHVTRFLICLNLVEIGKPEFLELALTAACQEATPSWLQRADLERLKRLSPSERWLALRLTRSPHPHGYRFSVNQLIGERSDENEVVANPEYCDEIAAALRAFLDCGSNRMRNLRIDAATWLSRCGDQYGYPLLMESEAEQNDYRNSILKTFPRELVEESVDAALLAGRLIFDETKIMLLLELNRYSPEEYQSAAIELNAKAVSNKVRQALARHLGKGLSRSQKLRSVADTFAWGVPIARELTGRLFTIEMIGGDDYGYTKLNENKISINPLPILQRKPSGREVVEGLILHELGHHMYHRGEKKQTVWDEADKNGLGSLLNLVADEHLERNLRAMDDAFGDRLKKLGAHVFRHAEKEVDGDRLLNALNIRAFEVLSNSRIQVARRAGCMKLSTRRVLQEMEKNGLSFSRFFHALRLGLGNRHDDPKVAEALLLFGKEFRHRSMKQLYQITLRLREIFGSECEILNCLGQSQIMDGEGSQVMIDGEGITNGEVQSEIQRISNPEKRVPDSKGSTGRWINISGNLKFDPITMIERVTATPAEHQHYANDVLRYASQLRRYLSELGLVFVPQRRRVRGRSLDRSSLRSAILRGDPRILKLREPRFETDLFIGVLIDCSGSMDFNDNIEKAKLFGALMTEAVRGMSAIDLRVFGFTDSVIYDAGSSERPGLANFRAGGGNNDAAALLHAAQQAQYSRRRAKLLVMISDGLPTECSTEALKSLVQILTRKWKMCCAQVAVQPLEEICFPDYVLLDTSEPAVAVREFGTIIAKLVRKSLAQSV